MFSITLASHVILVIYFVSIRLNITFALAITFATFATVNVGYPQWLLSVISEWELEYAYVSKTLFWLYIHFYNFFFNLPSFRNVWYFSINCVLGPIKWYYVFFKNRSTLFNAFSLHYLLLLLLFYGIISLPILTRSFERYLSYQQRSISRHIASLKLFVYDVIN